jgi:putative NADH-flavin reductase
MRIAVIGAFGKAGSLIAEEAISRGHDVTAIARRKHDDRFAKLIEKDLMDLTRDDLTGFDAVVDAASAWTPDTFHIHTDGISHLHALLEGTDARFLMMGGAGTLFVNKEHTMMVKDQPDYPEQLKPLAAALTANLERIRSYSDWPWTYVTSPHHLTWEGKDTGKYIIGGEEFFTNAKGECYISYRDFAKAFVDIIEDPKYIRRRVSVVGEP